MIEGEGKSENLQICVTSLMIDPYEHDIPRQKEAKMMFCVESHNKTMLKRDLEEFKT